MEDKNLKRKLNYLGTRVNYKVFVYVRLVSSLVIFSLLVLFCNYGYIVAPIVTLIHYILIEYIVIDKGISIRKAELENDSLEFFPLFLLTLNSNKNVKKSLEISTEIVDNSISKEFKKVLDSVDIGKSLSEVLLDMNRIIPSDSINRIIINIMEAKDKGCNINDSVNSELDYLNTKRRNKIINKAKNLPLVMGIYSISLVFIMFFILIIFNIFS